MVSGASIERPPSPSTDVRNGSAAQIASTRSAFSAAPISGKGTSSSLKLSGATPRFSRAALTTVSPTPLSALTAIVLPARSLGVRIWLSAATRICVHSFSAVIAPLSAFATSLIGSPFEAADAAGT